MSKVGTLAVQGLKAFGKFWWDFVIGDTPELAVATALIIGAAVLLRHERMAATVVLPLLAASFLLASTVRGRKRTPKADG